MPDRRIWIPVGDGTEVRIARVGGVHFVAVKRPGREILNYRLPPGYAAAAGRQLMDADHDWPDVDPTPIPPEASDGVPRKVDDDPTVPECPSRVSG